MVDSQRRQIVSGLLGASAAVAFPTPALALSEEFMLSRGDIRIGLLSDYPPFVFQEGSWRVDGILPSIATHFAHELFLSASYAYIDLKELELYSYVELFKRFGGLDLIMHAPISRAEEQFIPRTSSYMNDYLGFLINPDVRQIGIFPRSFDELKVIAFHDQLVDDFIAHDDRYKGLDIDFDVSINDLRSGLVFEKILSGDYSCFISSHRQIEWMMQQSVHKFNINEVYFTNQNANVYYCVMINPRSEWLLPKIQERLDTITEDNSLSKIFQKYHLISEVIRR